jgi:hypothetical protein
MQHNWPEKRNPLNFIEMEESSLKKLAITLRENQFAFIRESSMETKFFSFVRLSINF